MDTKLEKMIFCSSSRRIGVSFGRYSCSSNISPSMYLASLVYTSRTILVRVLNLAMTAGSRSVTRLTTSPVGGIGTSSAGAGSSSLSAAATAAPLRDSTRSPATDEKDSLRAPRPGAPAAPMPMPPMLPDRPGVSGFVGEPVDTRRGREGMVDDDEERRPASSRRCAGRSARASSPEKPRSTFLVGSPSVDTSLSLSLSLSFSLSLSRLFSLSLRSRSRSRSRGLDDALEARRDEDDDFLLELGEGMAVGASSANRASRHSASAAVSDGSSVMSGTIVDRSLSTRSASASLAKFRPKMVPAALPCTKELDGRCDTVSDPSTRFITGC
mmetsp:Transcript_12164/g.38585  ORF Transcript_12164/g.38585 Transcript_12164/m.38585 type:complete len:327 (+) Transcript_12164:928-1908(+)